MIIFLSIGVGLRNDGPDFDGYLSYYNISENIYAYMLQVRQSFGLNAYQTEIVFFSLVAIFKSLGLGVNYFLLFICIFEAILLINLVKFQRNPFIFIFGYLFCIFFIAHGWYIKQGLSTLFLLNSYYYFRTNKKTIAALLLAIGCLVHISSAALLIILIILYKFKSNVFYIILLTLSFLYLYLAQKYQIGIFDISLLSIYASYKDSEWGDQIDMIGSLGVASLLLLFGLRKIEYSKSLGALLIIMSILILNFGYGLPLIGRLSTMLTPLGIVLVLANIKYTNSKTKLSLPFFSASFFLIYFFRTYYFNDIGHSAFSLLINGAFHSRLF
jgi:hypothetical protein